jgi:acyl-CoA thioesterase FadM
MMDKPVAADERTATIEYRVRFDEAGPDGLARPAWFLRVAQDAAWIHAERLGFTRARYAAEGIAWLVRAVALDVGEPVGHGERMVVSTRVVGHRRIWARRRTTMTRDGLTVATVVTDWVLVGADGRPRRIPAEVIDRLPGDGSDIEAIRVDSGPAPADALVVDDVVRPDEIDPMGHVNNAAYLDRLAAAAVRIGPPLAAMTREHPSIRIEYAAAAGPGQTVREVAWPIENGRGLAYRMVTADEVSIVRAELRPDGRQVG